ncbi:MAG: SWIM zinc finger family protein [Patescibacteria group bacterium]
MDATPHAWRDVALEDLEAVVPRAVLERGREYLSHGRVAARLVAGDRLAGSVMGSAGWYTAEITLAGGELVSACTCPYDGPFCKHAVALLLAWLNDPAGFADLESLLAAWEASPGALRRLSRELCLAAPARALQLLAPGGDGAGVEAAASLASNVLAWKEASLRDLDALGERLDWLAQQLGLAVARGDADAAAAWADLAGRLLDLWREAPAGERLTGLVRRHLLAAADAFAGRGGQSSPALVERLAGLIGPETRPFLVEIVRWLIAAGAEAGDLAAAGGEAREVMNLLRRGPSVELVKTADFSALLLLLDALERWRRPGEAAALARACLRRPEEAERYVFRQRLARYHLDAGERRQGLAYLCANFRARPDQAGWEALRRVAREAAEWPRVKREIWPVVLAGGRDLRARAALDERDPELLSTLAAELGHADRWAVTVRAALAAYDPESGLGLLLAGARDALSDGGYAARKRAASYLRALARACRGLGRAGRWEEIRAGLREEFPPALNWPELGALLAGEEEPS